MGLKMELGEHKGYVCITGDTKPHKEQLKKLGGRYNPNLNGKPGWIFFKATREELRTALPLLRNVDATHCATTDTPVDTKPQEATIRVKLGDKVWLGDRECRVEKVSSTQLELWCNGVITIVRFVSH